MHLQGLTYKVKVALSSQAVGKQTDHLVKLYAPINNGVHGNQRAHAGVHLLVHQPEGQRLVSHQGLNEQIRHFSTKWASVCCLMNSFRLVEKNSLLTFN